MRVVALWRGLRCHPQSSFDVLFALNFALTPEPAAMYKQYR